MQLIESRYFDIHYKYYINYIDTDNIWIWSCGWYCTIIVHEKLFLYEFLEHRDMEINKLYNIQ